MTQRVLVVDDDHAVRDVVRRYLERAGYQVTLASDGETALHSCAETTPDLLVLDLMLPGIGGLEICRRVRTEHRGISVVMLTALGEESDRVLGLELGADDYVVKPFSPRELVLRVGSVLRRSDHVPDVAETLTDGTLRLDPAARRCVLGDTELSLTTREFDLLAFLLRHPGRAFTRAELLEAVWGWSFGDDSTVTVHMRRLREKIEPRPQHPVRISTVWGVGYRYDPQGPS